MDESAREITKKCLVRNLVGKQLRPESFVGDSRVRRLAKYETV